MDGKDQREATGPVLSPKYGYQPFKIPNNPGFHDNEQNTITQSCDDYIKCKISLGLLCCNSNLEFMETKVLSSTYPRYSLRVYESDISEWLP